MPDSIGLPGFLCLFVIFVAVVAGGFFWGYSMKQERRSQGDLDRADWIFLALDVVSIAAGAFCLWYDVAVGAFIFGLATALFSGILSGRCDLDQTNVRWF